MADDDFLDVLGFVACSFNLGVEFVFGFVADSCENVDELRSPLRMSKSLEEESFSNKVVGRRAGFDMQGSEIGKAFESD